ncbi:MAG TPA: glycoside hydrolase family 3 N-terminal domain-containing protein [Longimicrobiales bacterium]
MSTHPAMTVFLAFVALLPFPSPLHAPPARRALAAPASAARLALSAAGAAAPASPSWRVPDPASLQQAADRTAAFGLPGAWRAGSLPHPIATPVAQPARAASSHASSWSSRAASSQPLPAGVSWLPAPPSSEWVDATLARLTLREKVGQMVMPWIPGGELPRAEARRARELVVEDEVGGLIVGKGDGVRTAVWLNHLQRASAVPLLVAADLEWGPGTRLEGATVLPVNMAIAAAGGPELAYEAGRITAREARAAGVHMAFAPVADVNVNAANPVINTRSYGADPIGVAERVAAFIEGARAEGLLTVAKHFPGHGDTEQDSHLTLPAIHATRWRLETVELVPFRTAIAAGVTGIMTAHLAVPALDPEHPTRPATLSHAILTDLLRGAMGFDGLIVTDGLMMDGIREGRTVGEVAVEAVQAGADILLMPPDATEAIDAVVGAVEAGRIAEARIDAAVRRILEAKAAVGLDRRRTVDLDSLRAILSAPEHQRWAQDVANRSLTLVRRPEDVLPFELAGKRVVQVAYDDSRHSDDGEEFARALERQGARVETVRLWERSRTRDIARARRAARGADLVVFSSFARALPWKGELGLPSRVAALANELAADGAVVISFGDPYLLRQLTKARTYLLAWSEAEVAQRAAARALGGAVVVAGRLPIPLPPDHAIGEGLRVPALPGEEGDHDVAETDADVRVP